MTTSDCMAVGALAGMVLLVAIFAWAVGYADGCRERDTDEIEIEPWESRGETEGRS